MTNTRIIARTSSGKWWIKRLNANYDAARKRNGSSLSIYSEVANLINRIEDTGAINDELIQEADRLCSTLRRA